ncbi:hypothetical protein CR513_10477, partial [Mucuna pruriens]
MTYIELLPQLLKQKLMEIIPLKPLEPPYQRSYDPNARCDYHGGAIGHAIERCWSLKHKVQDLLEGGLLGFEDQGLNMQSNPLPAHRNVAINTISHDNNKRADKTNRRQGKGSTTKPVVNPSSRLRTYNWKNKANVASVMYIEENSNLRPRSLIIHYNLASQAKVSFIVQVLARQAYSNNTDVVAPLEVGKDVTLEITNIAETGAVTRSRRVFAPDRLWNKNPTPVRKDKVAETPQKGGEGRKGPRFPQNDPT